MFHIFVAFVVLTPVVSGQFTTGCRDCICQTEGCEPYVGECYFDVVSDSCGPFAIKLVYWCDANYIDPAECTEAVHPEWRDCAKEMACSITTVEAYMARYGTYCTGGVTPTCEDYARIHNGGPNGCSSSATEGYWDIVQQCCNTNGNC